MMKNHFSNGQTAKPLIQHLNERRDQRRGEGSYLKNIRDWKSWGADLLLQLQRKE